MNNLLSLFTKIEKYAAENKVPIIKKAASRLLIDTVKQKQPKAVLEIGTAIGYSTLLITKHLPADTKIITIELDAERIKIAQEYIAEAGMSERIQMLQGDAGKVLLELNNKFDLVFIDAAKGQYLDYLKKIMNNLADDAVILADNVLFRGMVMADTAPIKRYRTIVKRLREYIEYVSTDPQFSTKIYDDGDGMAISYYKREVR